MRHFLFVLGLFLFVSAHAQDDLLSDLEKSQANETDYVIQTFKGTRVVNGHSIETKPAGNLEFIISHRFGPVNSGSYELWGLDASTIRLGLEYGITDELGVGVGRSSWDKSYDMYLKYKILRQATGANSFPFTMTLLGSTQYMTLKDVSTEGYSSSDRLSYAFQALIARKFSSFSFQVAPIWVHRNRVDESITSNDIIALGLGLRAKITRSVAIHAEYYPRLNEKDDSPFYNAIGFGIDIETGGHVFQLVFTNSVGMMERIMVTETIDDFWDGGIRFGFNITRTFQLSKKSRTAGW
ncbi:MAG TPA: DUF5777 family beta-barrel protein [Cyclobacteriaceae bacterium]|nr:DUF5777 family beta-barrel protein [Cyclobacteriaceae bacterium]